jgi:HAD superfamily hydrolase (TIGR01549 family)
VKLEGNLFPGDKINGILFDLDGTLRHNKPSSVHAFFDYAVQFGLPDSSEKRKAATRWAHYYWAQSSDLADDLRIYQELDDPFWTNYSRRNLLAFDCEIECAQELAPKMVTYMNTEYQPEDWVPEDVPTTLQALRERGYHLGVLSNRSQPCQDHLNRLGLLDYFDFALVAGEVNVWKPDPMVFQHALKRMGTTPEQTIYVGDNYYADIVGAQAANMVPVLVDPEEIFPDAACPVISTLGELQVLLNHHQPEQSGD